MEPNIKSADAARTEIEAPVLARKPAGTVLQVERYDYVDLAPTGRAISAMACCTNSAHPLASECRCWE
jgi:hypothetical protein